ncbi:MAG: GrpB-like predicted nucleotidyltransferase (UPF0157 family) [Arenicella sp.]|jgi:GrpB-like predicted nucleotidyltransferase (UPF0157 family)
MSRHHFQLLKSLNEEFGEIHGEPIYKRFRRWQSVKSPEISLAQQSYDAKWPQYFQQSVAEFARVLGSVQFSLEHIGSTSIRGMAAKPIIDSMLILESEQDLDQVEKCLQKINYNDWGESPVHPGVRWWWSQSSSPIQRVVHVCVRGNAWSPAAINFRDYLRQFPDKRRQYMQQKRQLSESSESSVAIYSLKKAALLYRLNGEANAWRDDINRS